jgi:IS66 C-terminal element
MEQSGTRPYVPIVSGRSITIALNSADVGCNGVGGSGGGRVQSSNFEPFAWLRDVLPRVTVGHPASRLDELLPWNWQ